MDNESAAFARSETPKAPTAGVAHSRVDIPAEEQSPAVTLEWRDVTLHAHTKAKRGTVDASPPVLSAVSAFALPGELLAVMGPPDAGKTTLLNVLNGRTPGRLSADSTVTLDGQPLTASSARLHTAFVEATDLFFNSITVRDHLLFHAHFHREHTRQSEQERQQRVDHVLRENGLEAVRDSPVIALSPVLKKRVAIASELVGYASVLLVDEPTAGLDPFMELSIVSQLKYIASSGNKTVVAAITEPSSEVFALFDKVLLLGAGGKVMYHGPAASAVAYFAERGFHCPTFFGAADFLVTTVSVRPTLPSLPWESSNRSGADAADGDDSARIETLAQAWETHRASSTYQATLPAYHAAVVGARAELDREALKGPRAAPSDSSRAGRAAFNFAVLVRRNIARLRNKRTVVAMTVQPMVASVGIGLIYLQPDMDQLGMQSLSSVFFVFTMAMVMMNAIMLFITMPPELALVEREHKAGLYHLAAWYLAKNVTELPHQIVQPFFFLLPAYFMVGIGHGADLFFYIAVILILVVSAAVGYGYMISCIARRTNMVVPIGLAILLPMFILGGVLVNPRMIRDYLVWIAYISPFKYAFEAMMNLFWERVDVISCYPSASCSTTSGMAVLVARSLTDRTPWASGLLLVALNVAARIIGLLALLFL